MDVVTTIENANCDRMDRPINAVVIKSAGSLN